MPKLAKVRCTLAVVSSTVEENGVSRMPVSMALAGLGTRLVDLEVSGANYTWGDGEPCLEGRSLRHEKGQLATFLSHVPSLSRLFLCIDLDPPGHEILIATLSTLRHLKQLDIDSGNFVDEAFATAPWACPLETLSMPDSLPFPFFLTFLRQFSTTLKSLTLSPDPFVHKPWTPAPFSAFALSQLHTLVIDTDHREDFLTYFTSCPLQYLTIQYSSRIDPEAWHAFVLSHAATLKRVTISATAAMEQLEELFRAVCEANGIECVVEGTS